MQLLCRKHSPLTPGRWRIVVELACLVELVGAAVLKILPVTVVVVRASY
jgi:hypothetical protein